MTKYRPHNFELKQYEQTSENYKTLMNLGFLQQHVLHANLGKALNVPQMISRPGRPVTVPLTYEEM